MTKKLLNKTTGSFLAYSVIILLIAAPVFYFISHWLYIYETDEILIYHKKAFLEHNKDNFTAGDIATWNKYNRDTEIVADRGIKKDSIFGKMYFDTIANENEPFRELWAPIDINGKRYTYIERNNLVEMEGMVFSVAIMFLLIIVILLVVINWISKRSAAEIWKPFHDTLKQIHNFEIDKSRQPSFIATNIEEFDRLNKSIGRLIEKNTIIYKNQREFIENAAHELQTPLALFQAKIDTLSQFQDLTKEQSQLLGSLNNDVSRMNRLNKNLLLLSKIESDNYPENQPFTLNDYIRKNLDFFEEQAKPKNLSITLEFHETVAVEANPALAEVLVNNLLLNAIRHNVKGGKIIIATGAHSVTFYNTGEGSALNVEKLFNRFSKSGPSSQGNGLGLAIVKKIVDLNNWTITYTFSKDMHSFTVEF